MKIIVLNLSLACLISVVSSEMEGFIVGGEYANIKNHPHSAFLWISCHMPDTVKIWACGSSIMNQHLLLTAAHCLEECLEDTEVLVSVGHSNKKHELTHAAHSFKIHEKYDTRLLYNDIAVVKLDQKLRFGPKVKRVVLMKRPPSVQNAKLAGWGLINEEDRTGTMNLKEARQKLWTREKCLNLFQRMPEGTICTHSGSRKGSNRIGYGAEGDSGSGLLINGFIVIGVVSYKNPRLSKSVVVFTEVAYHYNWIIKTANSLYCKTKQG